MEDLVGPGSTGPEVREVQKAIGVPITGIYDEETTARVRGLQILYGLPMTDGVVGDAERAIMDELSRPPRPSTSP